MSDDPVGSSGNSGDDFVKVTYNDNKSENDAGANEDFVRVKE